MTTLINIHQRGIPHTRTHNVVFVIIMSFCVCGVAVLAHLRKTCYRVCVAAAVAVVAVLCDPTVETQAKTPIIEDEFDYLDDVMVSEFDDDDNDDGEKEEVEEDFVR